MDRKRKKQLQNARVIMTNIFMGVSVIGIVFVLMLVAMGYNFGENGLTQSGLIQISSNPKGASVEIDGEGQFSHTDFNKMLSAGEHRIKISKTGYDTWEKNIIVDPGLLTRVEWARLFPLKADISSVANFNSIRLAEFSRDRKRLFVIERDTPIAQYIDIQGEKIRSHKLSLNDALGKDKNVLDGQIDIVSWNETGNKLLATWTLEQNTTWYLIDLDNAAKSINLNKAFGINFNSIRISNDSASKLWALENGNLHIIDTSNHTISGILLSNVEQFENNKDVVSYVGLDAEDHNYRKISIFKEGEKGSTHLLNLKEEKPTITLSMGTYWNESWVAYSIDSHIVVSSGTYPSFDKPSKNSLKEIVKRDLGYMPQYTGVNTLGRIAMFGGGNNNTAIDIETRNNFDSTTDTELSTISWIDDYLTWENNNGTIVVRDFDGNNRREIITVNNEMPVVISENNRWLYFFEAKTTEETSDEVPAQNATEKNTSSKTIYTLKRQKLE